MANFKQLTSNKTQIHKIFPISLNEIVIYKHTWTQILNTDIKLGLC